MLRPSRDHRQSDACLRRTTGNASTASCMRHNASSHAVAAHPDSPPLPTSFTHQIRRLHWSAASRSIPHRSSSMHDPSRKRVLRLWRREKLLDVMEFFFFYLSFHSDLLWAQFSLFKFSLRSIIFHLLLIFLSFQI